MDSLWRSTLPEPRPEDFRRLRGKRTAREMAELAGLGAGQRWSEYENGTRRPSFTAYEWLLLKLGEHPTHKIVRR